MIFLLTSKYLITAMFNDNEDKTKIGHVPSCGVDLFCPEEGHRCHLGNGQKAVENDP